MYFIIYYCINIQYGARYFRSLLNTPSNTHSHTHTEHSNCLVGNTAKVSPNCLHQQKAQRAQHPLSRNNNSSGILITTKRARECGVTARVAESGAHNKRKAASKATRGSLPAHCQRSLWHTQTKTLAERTTSQQGSTAATALSHACCVFYSLSLSLCTLSRSVCGCGLRALISCGCCAANLQENLSSFTVGFVGQVVKNERRAELSRAEQSRAASSVAPSSAYCQEVATTKATKRR